MAQMIFDKALFFYEEECTYPGVKHVAENVKKDIELIIGHRPQNMNSTNCARSCVIYGTVGKSNILQELEQKGKLDLSPICGKREVYLFRLLSNPTPEIECALVIAGSDKRGTIYGLYHLSEVLGVSPLVNWNHVWPEKKDQIVLDDKYNMISKEPSVKYRGFFINDEWPAFGTWATEHFGGINAKCYEVVFELLLRLKGNYLWPAMWNSNFSLDGPGLESAKLADELGVVMSSSHHEPCMRAGAEYRLFRGPDSKYGDAWSFLTNPEGITEFWRDGLLRNRQFENVITMGMRGGNDTAILGAGCTLKDNIDLLRQVLKVQNQLIRETVNEDLSKVPRQIVLFTEVEEFFYGNQDTPGLIGDPELEGVTLMLSDNNQGSTRTLPSEKIRNHPGGYGMYYHMDMHGGPHAFEWIGSTYLPKVWEQMTAAYEYGVRDIWVTNVGDIGTQEYGLSFFLDLAYDMEKWGGTDVAITKLYTKEWISKHFRGKEGKTVAKPEDPKKDNYTFNGWYTDSKLKTAYDFEKTVSDNITLYAKWQAKVTGGGGGGVYIPPSGGTPSSYTVTFNSKGGSAVDSVTVTSGATISAPAEPTKEMKVFTGWYTDSACTNLFDFTTPITGNITLYAGWEDDHAAMNGQKISDLTIFKEALVATTFDIQPHTDMASIIVSTFESVISDGESGIILTNDYIKTTYEANMLQIKDIWENQLFVDTFSDEQQDFKDKIALVLTDAQANGYSMSLSETYVLFRTIIGDFINWE